ncbi:MAG: hypothetical protein WD875_17045 [Pirellulales bacterium]
MGKLIRIALALTVAVLGGSALRAEDAAVDKLYGEGVHAYFAGNIDAALKHLDASVAAGNRDPRCYYYRGLANWKLAKADAAKADFTQGAKLEAQSPELTTMINRSIQRVQGRTRLTIEKFRSDAQLAALAARKARDTARYGAARASAIDELRKQAEAPKGNVPLLPDAATPDAAAPDAPATDAADAAAAADAPPAKDPFADEPATDPAAEPAADPMDDVPAIKAPPEIAPPEEMPIDDAPAADADAPAAESAEDPAAP